MHSFRLKKNAWCLGVLVVQSALFGATTQPEEQPIVIAQPTVDIANHTVMLPSAFWNKKLASWVEVALCGRASDFLHETIVEVPTTKSLLLQAMRKVGFRDGDAFAKNVGEFARIRGDRFIILLRFTLNGKEQVYSVDELLSFEGWNSPVGPFGFMFKGEPQGGIAATTLPDDNSDASKILHDDPQIALTFKGLQHQSQSFADHPLAYDDWVYPQLNFARNYSALPASVYDSNGNIPITLTIQKVSEEELLNLSAKYAHNKSYADYILKQLPIAKQIDADKQALFGHTAKSAEIAFANITSNYSQLDAAWTRYCVDHLDITTQVPEERAALITEAKRWLRHMESIAERDKFLAEIPGLRAAEMVKEFQPQRIAIETRVMLCRAGAIEAENAEVLDYWNEEFGKIDPASDPRSDYIAAIKANLELAQAKKMFAEAERNYANALQAGATDLVLGKAKSDAGMAGTQVRVAELKLELFNLNFEIGKRKDSPDDPDLAKFIDRKARVEKALLALQNGPQTAPATNP